jgi:hypothetical protein
MPVTSIEFALGGPNGLTRCSISMFATAFRRRSLYSSCVFPIFSRPSSVVSSPAGTLGCLFGLYVRLVAGLTARLAPTLLTWFRLCRCIHNRNCRTTTVHNSFIMYLIRWRARCKLFFFTLPRPLEEIWIPFSMAKSIISLFEFGIKV